MLVAILVEVDPPMWVASGWVWVLWVNGAGLGCRYAYNVQSIDADLSTLPISPAAIAKLSEDDHY